MTRRKMFASDYRYLALLEKAPFERHPRGGWRFGLRRISDSVAERLIACGLAEQFGPLLKPAISKPRKNCSATAISRSPRSFTLMRRSRICARQWKRPPATGRRCRRPTKRKAKHEQANFR